MPIFPPSFLRMTTVPLAGDLRVEVRPVADGPWVGGCWRPPEVGELAWVLHVDEERALIGCADDAGDLRAARSGEEPPDLAGLRVGHEQLVVADAVVATIGPVLRRVGDVGLDPQPSVVVEPQSVR